MANRDYSLLGPDAERAVETGLAAAEWYHTDIPRKEMKALMKREDQPAIRDTIILFGCDDRCLPGIGIALWPSWWSAPFWLAYGVLYGSAMDSRWHECGHGTAFRTGWMNDAVYQVASFCMIRNPGRPGAGATRATTPTPSSSGAIPRSSRCARRRCCGFSSTSSASSTRSTAGSGCC